MDSMAMEMTPEWAASVWPVCNNLTVHGPNSNQKPASSIRMAAMTGRDSWYDMEKYSRTVTWVCLALIGVAVLPGFMGWARRRWPKRALATLQSMPFYFRTAAFLRSITYQRCSLPLGRGKRIDIPDLGKTLVIASFSIGMIVWCFAVTPYYRCTREWGSPPLAIRAGMLANGMITFVFAFGTKVNLVTALTNIAHERLQVYHQWLARLVLFFSVVHTIPFIVQPLRDGGSHNLYLWWYHNGPEMWNGTVSLALLAWIVASSTNVFRSWSYEFFVVQHLVSVILFIGFYFAHTGNELNSWLWLWAAIGLWGLATLIRWARSAMASGYFVSTRASVEVHSSSDKRDAMVRIAIRTPLRWSPGQHVFVRFHTMSPWQAHPFTVVTLPQPSDHQDSVVVFLARVREGLTRKLYERVVQEDREQGDDDAIEKGGSSFKSSDALPLLENSEHEGHDDENLPTKAKLLPASIDGPYGCSASMASYHSLVIVAGGSGMTFALPILFDLAWRGRTGNVCTRDVVLICSVRTPATLSWIRHQLEAVLTSLASYGITVRADVHVTRSASKELPILQGCDAHLGRPQVTARVDEAIRAPATSFMQESRAVVVCGPQEMSHEVQDSVASVQSDLLRGRLSNVVEVALVRESFGW
ncbi:hypothetical protein FA10DRAFT_264198 [Acaromyces ingoldii]|uniref:ferric-chelate reductase (NADPH) n=1 Tax=Acaromyces ingoldii TaxID=215250 RepID=A0A316YZV0_9BASI|nr:hypothetical protein FA10DRAFT_264198 [Acaromyces ingoldii]PWN93563.1 hypothetical protein FA10DRAFT_264198 [Acaromyces ingoldii]